MAIPESEIPTLKSFRRPLTVYKIGGSLFNLPQLGQVIRNVLAQRPHNAALLVAGGGFAADTVREWDRVHQLGEEAAHWLALEAMDLGTALIASLVPEIRMVRSPHQARSAVADGVISILCTDCFLKAAQSHGHLPLEHSWMVTSDSIAAWTAGVLAASELVLVKSVNVPRGMSSVAAAEAGLVDEHFPLLAANVAAIGWVNARAGTPRIESWL